MRTGLLFKKGDDGAIGTQDVAEAGRNKLGRSFDFVLFFCLIKTLHVDFANSLAASHYIGRIYGFVGRNHHELLHAKLDAQVGYYLRAVDIVEDTLARVVFHHRHVLVSGGVEDVVGTKGGENLFHPYLVRNGGDDSRDFNAREVVQHQQAYVVLRRLCLIDKHQFGRLQQTDLPNHLAANAARRSGNQNARAGYFLTYTLHINLNLIARQKVFDADLL